MTIVNGDAPELHAEDYRKLSALLHDWTGIRLQGKETLMSGRLKPLMRTLRLQRYREYYDLLAMGGKGSQNAEAFINALTTNKTAFFREPHHFDYLVNVVFAAAHQRALQGGPRRLRLYSAGCSRGAEPYTMAMLAAQHLPKAQGWDVRILATDLDTKVLAEAKRGVYDVEEAKEVPIALRTRWMLKERADAVRVRPDAAALVTFARANFVASPFPVRGQFDAIFCRNVMIYFDKPTQDRLVGELMRLLSAHGVLLVGHSETLMLPGVERDMRVVGAYRARPRGSIAAASPASTATHPRAPASQRVRDPMPDLPRRRIVLGQCFSSARPHVVSTLLGSCVAACIYDPVARVGGMNHFMLPQTLDAGDDSARFGVHAMELLINELMQLGAERPRLLAKVFGAAAVNRALVATANVAQQNADFVRAFLAKEGIALKGERLSGELPREVAFRTDTGEAFVRTIETSSAQVQAVVRYEIEVQRRSIVHADARFDPDDVLF